MNPILVVDDDPGVLSAVVRSLEIKGYRCVGARCKAEALSHAGESFALLVLDLRLPNGDGRDIALAWPTSPVLTMSGWHEEHPDLYKPFTLEVLHEAVRVRVSAGAP